MLTKDLLCLGQCCTCGSGYKVVLCHNVSNALVVVNEEAHVSVGNDSNDSLFGIAYRNT